MDEPAELRHHLHSASRGRQKLLERSVIAEILAKSDLLELIGRHVSLRRQGQSYVGLCPFHSERSPSFNVRPDRGFFKCFGCGVGGDAIKFVEQMENCSFTEAAHMLAKQAGVELVEESAAGSEQRAFRDAIYEANTLAARFYHRYLMQEHDAQEARDYTTMRGLDGATLERFVIGFAPNAWHALRDYLRQAGIADAISVQAGLLREGNQGLYDFYRNRLMIPTTAITGEIIAFGGRALGNDEPKYLNTSSTPVYTKGKFLFGLAQARRAVHSTGAFIVVEGYLDCIALHRVGFEHTVASLGTAFTADQAALLKRYTSNIYLAFDSDRAGRGAMLKSLAILKDADCRARVIELPAGEDPDSVVRNGGKEAFQKFIETSREAAEVLIDEKLAALNDGFHTQADKTLAAEQIVRAEPRADWFRWRRYVAESLGIPIDDLLRAIGPVPLSAGLSNSSEAARPKMIAPPSRERELLAILLEEPSLFREYRHRISAERIRDPRLHQLYRLLSEAASLDSHADVLIAINGDESATEGMLLLMTPERSPAVRFTTTADRCEALDTVVEALESEDDAQRLRQLTQQIDEHLVHGPAPVELLAQHRELELRLIKRKRLVRKTP